MKSKRMNPKKTSQNSFFDIRPVQGENAIWKTIFPIFSSFTKEIQAKNTELESESNIFA